MKLRLEEGAIKIRLKPEEIEELFENRSISAEIYISDINYFRYSIDIDGVIRHMKVKMRGNKIVVQIPEEQANTWHQSKQIGMDQKIMTQNGDIVRIVVERDLMPKRNKNKEKV